MNNTSINEFINLKWNGGEKPIIQPPSFSPVIADPSFLFPHETPSKEWILYAHSAWGIHEYASKDGTTWNDKGLKTANAMRPFLRKINDNKYVLLYEKYSPFALPMQILPGKRIWNSHIEMKQSSDLLKWNKPSVIIEPSLEWMKDFKLGKSVSNPCLVENEGTYRLYFSASLAFIDDCGFCEPKYIGIAEAGNLNLPFNISPMPVIDPENDTLQGVVGSGSIKVIKMSDGWIGLQNKIYHDSNGSSRSAIFILSSRDGKVWDSARTEPLIQPDLGWKKSHVYACDCRFNNADGRWYLYFNARDEWKITKGKERIGRIVSM